MSLITRHHDALDGTVSEATFSACGLYRYDLRRRWGREPLLTYVMLNPSTADEQANDPTIARCETRARRLGYGGLIIANLFAFRATDPSDLKKASVPEGPENEAFVRRAASEAGGVLAAWGVHGAHLGQDARVMAWLKETPLMVLGLTKEGLPRHPLYVSYAIAPFLWEHGTPQAR